MCYCFGYVAERMQTVRYVTATRPRAMTAAAPTTLLLRVLATAGAGDAAHEGGEAGDAEAAQPTLI